MRHISKNTAVLIDLSPFLAYYKGGVIMDAYKYTITIDGNEVYFGFDGNRELALWGGSYCITYPHILANRLTQEAQND